MDPRDKPSKDPGLTVETSRRGFLTGVGTAVLGASIASLRGPAAFAEVAPKTNERAAFRFVYFPDTHLRDEFGSAEGLAAALQAVERLQPRPAFILTGGDLCHDLRALDLAPAQRRANLFVEIWRANTSLPSYHMLGNHDPAGWGAGEVPEDHPDYAFGLMQRVLGLERRYYSFDHGGWHFVVLDNVHLTTPGKHVGYVDEDQLAWLREDLRQSRGRPAIVAMHVPPLTASEFLTSRASQDAEKGQWRLGFDRMSRNPGELLAALGESDVRAILSGHLHLVERLELSGHTFLCAGSVSGQQWMGPRRGRDTPEGFGVLDLKPDGTFDWTYQAFGWQASAEALKAQGG